MRFFWERSGKLIPDHQQCIEREREQKARERVKQSGKVKWGSQMCTRCPNPHLCESFSQSFLVCFRDSFYIMKFWRLTQGNLWCSSQVPPTFQTCSTKYEFTNSCSEQILNLKMSIVMKMANYCPKLIHFIHYAGQELSIPTISSSHPSLPLALPHPSMSLAEMLFNVLLGEMSQRQLLSLIALLFLSIVTSNWQEYFSFNIST